MSKVSWKSITYKGYKEDLLPSKRALLYLHFEDIYGNQYRWTPPWKDLEEVFIKAIDIEKRNYPESAWDDELKKVILKSPSRPHDQELFQKSNTIIDERVLSSLFNQLENDASYSLALSDKLAEFLHFFTYESNRYISKILHDSCKRMLDAMQKLSKFLWESDLFFEVGPEHNKKMKLWPAYIVIEEMGVNQEQRDKQFQEYFVTLRKLVEQARSSYRDYRANIREVLFV